MPKFKLSVDVYDGVYRRPSELVTTFDVKEGRLDVKNLGGPKEQARDYAAFKGCLAVRNWEHGIKASKKAWGIQR